MGLECRDKFGISFGSGEGKQTVFARGGTRQHVIIDLGRLVDHSDGRLGQLGTGMGGIRENVTNKVHIDSLWTIVHVHNVNTIAMSFLLKGFHG